MIKVLISGCNGHMGQVVARMCEESRNMEVVGGFDLMGTGSGDFPVWSSPSQCTVEADAVIDFSSPAALDSLLDFGRECGIPLILCTTGYSAAQVEQISEASSSVPIFRSANMSLGINVLSALVTRASAMLDGFDVEIVERHHNRKVDAPSGTALMLADAAAKGLPYEPTPVYERQSVRRPRDRHEIGISSVRGGNIVGDHEVIFAGPNEVIELKHSAMSREVFASGAVKAAACMCHKAPGLYSMGDLVSDIL